MEAEINLQAELISNNNKKHFKLALLLALILNLIILLLLIFYSLDNTHVNFFQVAQQDRTSGSLPVYFDIGGNPQGSPSGTSQVAPQNLSVGTTAQAAAAINQASSQNLSVGFSDQDSPQQSAQENTPNKSGQKTQSQQQSLSPQEQAFKPGATKASELEFGFDDIEGEKDTKKFDKDKAMLKESLAQEQEDKLEAMQNLSQDVSTDKDKNKNKILDDKLSQEKTVATLDKIITKDDFNKAYLEEVIEQKQEPEFERELNLQDKVDLTFWAKAKQQKTPKKDLLDKLTINQKQNNIQTEPESGNTKISNSESTSSEKTSEKNFSKAQTQKRVLPKKAGSIFGKELLEGFKSYMQEQKYSTDSQDRSVSIGVNNYTSTNNASGTSGELGRSLSSQLRGEVNGMLLIKELALASRLDESMVQSEKFIDKIIPFELTIGEFGKVLNVELKDSCGSPSVDRHFVKLVYQSSPINHYARHYKGSPFKIMLSIRFIVPAGANRLLVTYGGN